MFEFIGGEGGRAEDFAEETDALFEGISAGFDGEGERAGISGAGVAAASAASPPASATAADLDIQSVHFLLQGLSIEAFSAGHKHGLEHACGSGLSFERFFVAEPKCEGHGNGFASGFHWQEADAKTAFFEALSAGFEVFGSGVECFTGGDGSASAVVLNDIVDGRNSGDGESLRCIGWNEHAKCSVPFGEIGFGDAIDVVRSDGLKAIALEEEQSPVAECGGGAECGGHGCGIGGKLFGAAFLRGVLRDRFLLW